MIKNIALVLVSLLVCALLTEVALRFVPIGNYSLNDRILFYSSPSLIRSTHTTVGYQPDTEIREVAIYGKNIDYDITKKTNNLGFYDNIPYTTDNDDKKGIAFLGDSFTSGTGGTKPFVTSLREIINRPEIQLYNLGVTGTGIHAFNELFKVYKDRLSFDEVNIMAITSDYFRRYWYPYETKEGIRLCLFNDSIEVCEKKPLIMHTIKHTDSQQDLIDQAQQTYKQKHTNADEQRTLLQKSRLFNLYCDGWFALNNQDLSSLHSQCPQHLINRSIWREVNFVTMNARQVLTDMKAGSPELKFRFFHIPEKSEMLRNEYSFDLKGDIVDSKMEYISLLDACHWDISMFHKHDAHPNDKGYENLAKCMAQFIQ